MKSRFRALVVAVALVLPWVATPVSPANASAAVHADILVMQGSGTITPGLGLVPESQSVSFSGIAIFDGTDGIGAVNCSFNGNDLAGSLAEGVGTISGSCGGLGFSLCAFVRVGAAWVTVCAGIVQHGDFGCVFNPNDILPTTSYALICEGLGVN